MDYVIKPILDPEFWRKRLQEADERHHALYVCQKENWDSTAECHRMELAQTIKPNETVLDAGCGWGRLLDLMPANWTGDYLGIDLSPDFIDLARKEHPSKTFVVGDIRNIPAFTQQYDWAVLISIKFMVIRNLGQEFWDQCEVELRRVAKELLFLEYTGDDYDQLGAKS